MKPLSLAAIALLFSSIAFADITIDGTAQALAFGPGTPKDRLTMDLATDGVSSGTLNAGSETIFADLTVTLAKGGSGSSIHIQHTLDSGDFPVAGASSDGIFTFTLDEPTDFAFTGLLEQQSTDPSGGGSVKIRNTSTFVTWYQANPNFALPNRPIDFSAILSAGTLPAGTYELTWFHAANRTSSSAQTLAFGDFTLSLSLPGCSDADFTADGVLDIFDVFAFIEAFNAMDPAADFDPNGVFDIFDVFAFVEAFNAGCP